MTKSDDEYFNSINEYISENEVRKDHLRAVHASSASPEWYTPPNILLLVLDVLEDIDLDPCSNIGVPVVPALKCYTINDDGLTKPWIGTVYMNPPYGKTMPDWTSKLEHEYNIGNVTEAIALLPARTDTRWFHIICHHATCFIKGRIRFTKPDGSKTNPSPFPSMAVYFGTDDTKFKQVFNKIGRVKV